ncbi:MAG: PKD domain-containing protein [Nitrososphaera sp.]|jgi:hypothetical protein
MTSLPRSTKLAIVFGAVGIAIAIGVTLFVVDYQTEGFLFQRGIGESRGQDSFDDPNFLQNFNQNLRPIVKYKTSLVVGEEGYFESSARGGTPPYTFEIKFDDGVTLTGQNVTRSFDTPGRHTFDLIVTDSAGRKVESVDLGFNVVEGAAADE